MIGRRRKKNRRIQSSAQPASRLQTVLADPRLRQWLGLLLLTVIVIAAGWQVRVWLQAMDKLTLQRVQVEGRFQNLQRDQVRDLLDGYAGRNFFDIDVAAIKHDLEQQPWIYEASVRRQWPDSLVVKIYEQTPVARWGEQGLINADAEVFYPHGKDPQRGFESLPRLDGASNSEHELLARLHNMGELLAPLGLKVAAMGLDARRAWTVRLDNGLELMLGREQAMQRVQRFLAFYSSLLAQRVADVEAVDLRYPNGFVLRWSAAAKQTPLG